MIVPSVFSCYRYYREFSFSFPFCISTHAVVHTKTLILDQLCKRICISTCKTVLVPPSYKDKSLSIYLLSDWFLLSCYPNDSPATLISIPTGNDVRHYSCGCIASYFPRRDYCFAELESLVHGKAVSTDLARAFYSCKTRCESIYAGDWDTTTMISKSRVSFAFPSSSSRGAAERGLLLLLLLLLSSFQFHLSLLRGENI